MRRRHDDDVPREERDVVLGAALDELDAPEYPPDFLASVWARVDAARTRLTARSRPCRRAGPTGRGPPAGVRRPVVPSSRVAAVIAVVVLMGMPGISRVRPGTRLRRRGHPEGAARDVVGHHSGHVHH